MMYKYDWDDLVIYYFYIKLTLNWLDIPDQIYLIQGMQMYGHVLSTNQVEGTEST